MELKVGQIYKSIAGSTVEIIKTDQDFTQIKLRYGQMRIDPTLTVIGRLSQGNWQLQENSLDKTSKEIVEVIAAKSKISCRHNNIREERYFSAMIYRTCKDCGKNLN